MLFCSRCGAPLQSGVAFCSKCGHAVVPAAPPAPPQYQALAGYAPPQQGAPRAAIMIPPAIASILTPVGLFPIVATILCWIFWFALPGYTLTIGGSAQPTFSLWNALAFSTTDVGSGSHGFLTVVVVMCLLAPFVAPFIRHRLARFLYGAPLFCFILSLIVIEITLSQFNSNLNSNSSGASSVIVVAMGYGTFLIGLASLAAAVGIFSTGVTSFAGVVQQITRVASRPIVPVAQVPAAYVPPPPVAYAPPPPMAYAPAPPPPARAYAAPPVAHAPAQPAGFCTSCGRPRAAGMQFCTNCGARFAS